MRSKRPGVVTGAAVVAIVFGVLGLLCGVCGLGSNLFLFAFLGQAGANNPAMAPVADMLQFMEQRAPGYRVVEIARPSLVAVLAVALLIGGVGLLNMKRWARTLTMVYAVLMIALQLIYTTYEVALVLPAAQAWQQDFMRRQAPGAPPPPGNFGASGAGVVLGALLSIGHAAALLVLLLLPGVSAAFDAAGRGKVRHEDEEEDEDEEDDQDDYDDRVMRRDRD